MMLPRLLVKSRADSLLGGVAADPECLIGVFAEGCFHRIDHTISFCRVLCVAIVRMSTPAATVTISGTKSNLASGSDTIGPLTIVNAASGGAITALTSVNGDNTVVVPGSNYIGCVIVPPSNSTVVKK